MPDETRPDPQRPDSPRTAAALLVDCLAEQGCDRIFTVPGESFLSVLDALPERPDIDVVTCRQEGGVAFMACADGAMNAAGSGRPGVAFVTRGPGATNASIGVHVAHQDSQPMILFVGDVARGMQGREGFQEVDFPAFFAPICKWAARIDDPGRIPEYIARAYATAINGRPGPVVLALPEDMLVEQVSAALAPAPLRHPRGAGRLPRCDAHAVRSDRRCRKPRRDHRRSGLERQGARLFPAICRAHRASRGHRFPPAGRDCAG